MKMKITDLLEYIDTSCDVATNKKAFLEVSLAVELAFAMQLPSQPVNCVVSYFEEFHAEKTRRVIGEINEMYPISVQVCYNLTVEYFKARYTMVHEPRLLTNSDIARLMSRPAVINSASEEHCEAMATQYFSSTRAVLAEFVGRYVLPVPAEQ